MRTERLLAYRDLQDEIDAGFVKEQKHPTERLWIYNYTPKAQYENHWNKVTQTCRGLITDDWDIVSRPFPKFFNYGQVEREMIPSGAIRVQDKMDGSLGILYRKPSNGELAIATRGSFTSDQAIHASFLLRSKYPDFEPKHGYTYLFEIVYPANRIVVDYGDTDDLVLLDIIANVTGSSALRHFCDTWPGPLVKEFEFKSLEEVLNTPPREGQEGFVVTFHDDSRLKVKQEEYVRLHRLLTGVSNVTIWESLLHAEGDLGSLNEILDRVPDEYYQWVKNTALSLIKEHKIITSAAQQVFHAAYAKIPDDLLRGTREHRKAFAELISNHNDKGLLFALYDFKSINSMVWKMIRPTYAKPFWNQNEDVA